MCIDCLSSLSRVCFYIVVFYYMFMCARFFWFSCQYLPSDWLERLLWWRLNVARRSPPWSPGQRPVCVLFIFRLVCLGYVFSPALHDIYFICLWQDVAYLSWKCHETPTNQTNPFLVNHLHWYWKPPRDGTQTHEIMWKVWWLKKTQERGW